MPTRPAIAAILVGWVLAAAGLFQRDILPDFRNTPPPDLRSIAVAGEEATPTAWSISVADDTELKNLRPVGRAYTDSTRKTDGSTVLISNVSFDSNGLLRGTPFAFKVDDPSVDGHLTINNSCEVDAGGNLRQFRVKVFTTGGAETPLMTIDARVVGHEIIATATSPQTGLNWSSKPIPYQPHGMVMNGIGPTDRLPGLQVGQRWETEVLNPMTGGLSKVLTEVTGKRSIQWNNGVVPTLEVVQRLSPVSARTWVRPDGLVLRQEIPLPFVRLIVERVPPTNGDGGTGKLGNKAS